MNTCRIPQEKLDFINKNHEKYTIKEISKLLDYNRSTLYAYYAREELSYVNRKNKVVFDLIKELIIEFFYSYKNNTSRNIAEAFNLDSGVVSHIINKHLDKKMKRINKRKYEDIDWGKL